MSFLDHIAQCNRHDLAYFLPFRVGGAEVGWVRPPLARAFADLSRDFDLSDEALTLDERLAGFEARSDAAANAVQILAERGAMPPLRDEFYAVAPAFLMQPLMQLDRGAVPSLGVRAYGVHVNGYLRRDDGTIEMWIGRRAPTQRLCPDMLDNMVAGGLPIGITPIDNVIKEAHEEANVPEGLARKAKPVSAVRYTMETDDGLRQDTMFCYDLELPDDFAPENTDGEVAEFRLMPAEEVKAIVRDTFDFKFNCNLVVLDFLIRHGLLSEDEADIPAIRRGMGQAQR